MIYCLISYANMTHLLKALHFNFGSFFEDHPSKVCCFYLHLCYKHNTKKIWKDDLLKYVIIYSKWIILH